MERVIVSGGQRLSGEVEIGGSKNAALPVLFAGILTGERCVFSNLPRVSDVLRTLEILRSLGARIHFCERGEVEVDYSTLRPAMPPVHLTASIRGSTYLLGALLGRFGEVRFGRAGGCDFGARPIDQHLAGFASLGAEVCEGETLEISAPNGLCGAAFTLAMPSVGATANFLLAAVLAKGESVLSNAAAEPHVAALADFLTAAGANIKGVGSDTVRVCGVPRLHGVCYRMIPDMIEAGTYLCAGLACRGPVLVHDVDPLHLKALLTVFSGMGAEVKTFDRAVSVSAEEGYDNTLVTTAPYPGFPTDLHPQLTALFSIGGVARGVGVVRETVFDSRFRYVSSLRAMGARIDLLRDTATVYPTPLHAAKLFSPDLRGGAALLLAALATRGESEITNAVTIARGYEHLAKKWQALGARIRTR